MIMFAVRCAGCARTVAVSVSDAPLRNRIYCEQWCQIEGDFSPNEERDEIMTVLSRVNGWSQQAISERFGVDRSRAGQAIARRLGPAPVVVL